jgi:hypothetical protein
MKLSKCLVESLQNNIFIYFDSGNILSFQFNLVLNCFALNIDTKIVCIVIYSFLFDRGQCPSALFINLNEISRVRKNDRQQFLEQIWFIAFSQMIS